MAARKTTDLTALTTPTANTLVPAVDLTEALPSNQNKKLTLADLTKGLSAATTGAAGVVQLSTSTSSTSTSLAATPSAVKSAYDLAAAALPLSGGTMTGAITFAGAQPTATTSAAGIVQLNDNINSTSTTQAATANAVKTAYDLANGRARITLDVAKNSTSGATIDFTGIPSWVERIEVVLSGVSTSGSSIPIIQLGTASGVETTGYVGAADAASNAGAVGSVSITAGLGLERSGVSAAASVRHGIATFINVSGNTWVGQWIGSRSDSACILFGATSKTLGGTLDRVRLTTSNGTDTFDAGVVNIMYEG